MNHAGEAYPIGLPVETLPVLWEAGATSSPRRSLAIVGSHPATRELAPYDDHGFEIWLFNEAPQKPEVYRRWDASFQMHKPEVYASEHNWVNQDHWRWLQSDHGDRTIWMQEIDPRVPNSKRYPLEAVLDMVGFSYLRSTPAMALALAIYLGYYDRIQLYGSELTSNTEYTYQAINYAFWIGFAKGRGIELELKCWQSEFYDHPIYGYHGEFQLAPEYFQGRAESMATELKYKQNALAKLENRLERAIQDHEYQRVGDLSLNVETLHFSVGELEGALAEAERYAARTNPISRQEFERVSAQAQKDGPDAKILVAHHGGKCEYVWNVWRQTGNLQALGQLRKFITEKSEQAVIAGRLSGVFQENLEYMHEYDRLITAAGGQRAVHQVANNGNG